MQSLGEKTDEVDKLKVELIEVKLQLDDATKSATVSSEDINITRFRKAYADLENEKKKQNKTHKKLVTDLEKSKKAAEEELQIALKKQKDSEDEKGTVVKIFECMRQLLDRNQGNIPLFPMAHANQEEINSKDKATKDSEDIGTKKKYSCDECDYQGNNSVRLNQHKKDKHLDC